MTSDVADVIVVGAGNAAFCAALAAREQGASVLESLTLSLQTGNGGVVLLALIRGSHAGRRFSAGQGSEEFLGNNLLSHRGRAAFPLAAGAVLIDMAALLGFPYDGNSRNARN